jgi:hypothetical protein
MVQISQKSTHRITVVERFRAQRLPRIASIHAGSGHFAGPTNYIATSADVGVFDGESTKDNNDYFQQKSSIPSIDLASGEKSGTQALALFRGFG